MQTCFCAWCKRGKRQHEHPHSSQCSRDVQVSNRIKQLINVRSIRSFWKHFATSKSPFTIPLKNKNIFLSKGLDCWFWCCFIMAINFIGFSDFPRNWLLLHLYFCCHFLHVFGFDLSDQSYAKLYLSQSIYFIYCNQIKSFQSYYIVHLRWCLETCWVFFSIFG